MEDHTMNAQVASVVTTDKTMAAEVVQMITAMIAEGDAVAFEAAVVEAVVVGTIEEEEAGLVVGDTVAIADAAVIE